MRKVYQTNNGICIARKDFSGDWIVEARFKALKSYSGWLVVDKYGKEDFPLPFKSLGSAVSACALRLAVAERRIKNRATDVEAYAPFAVEP